MADPEVLPAGWLPDVLRKDLDTRQARVLQGLPPVPSDPSPRFRRLSAEEYRDAVLGAKGRPRKPRGQRVRPGPPAPPNHEAEIKAVVAEGFRRGDLGYTVNKVADILLGRMFQ